MGAGQAKIPQSVERMQPTTKTPQVEIEYCGSWGGYPEAKYTHNMIKHVYPQAKIKMHSPGVTRNLVVIANGVKLYDKKETGILNNQRSEKLIKDIDEVSPAWFFREPLDSQPYDSLEENTELSKKTKSLIISGLF